MTILQENISNDVVCKVAVKNNQILITGQFRYFVTLDLQANELDIMIAFAKAIEQVVKEKVAVTSLEESDEHVTNVAIRCSTKLHENGKRPFMIITPAST